MKGILLILSLLFCSNCFALLTVGEYILLNKQIDDSEKPDKTDLKKYYELEIAKASRDSYESGLAEGIQMTNVFAKSVRGKHVFCFPTGFWLTNLKIRNSFYGVLAWDLKKGHKPVTSNAASLPVIQLLLEAYPCEK